jgi:dTDP-4-dehydrorhamnose 3,5-epimerase
MKVRPTSLKDVIILEPRVFADPRGYFFETYRTTTYNAAGIDCPFVQDNLSYSRKGTLRGLHYQYPHSQAKLVQVFQGEVLDVAVDIRRSSPTFGQWTSAILSDRNKHQMFIPEGFAHGFCVLSDTAVFTYKCSDFYAPEHEHGILWSDPQLAIPWPIADPVLSPKDQQYQPLSAIAPDQLPQ